MACTGFSHARLTGWFESNGCLQISTYFLKIYKMENVLFRTKEIWFARIVFFRWDSPIFRIIVVSHILLNYIYRKKFNYLFVLKNTINKILMINKMKDLNMKIVWIIYLIFNKRKFENLYILINKWVSIFTFALIYSPFSIEKSFDYFPTLPNRLNL